MAMARPDPWPWPDSLDGPVAAADNHRVLFENERVRVLENTGKDELLVIGVGLKDRVGNTVREAGVP